MLQVESPLVSVDWLHSNIEADNIVVLDATLPKVNGVVGDVSSGYIPKSQFFDIKKRFSDVTAQFPNTLPTKAQFEIEAQRLGINTNNAVIVYDQHGIYSGSRAWWLFKHFGHQNVAVLSGGLPEWISRGYNTIDTYKYQNIKGDFRATVDKDLIIDYEDLLRLLKSKDNLIIDARSAKRFSCETPEPRKGLRSGTIPNSVNLPYTDLLNETTLKSRQELKSIFDNLATNKKKLVFSCGSGITACNLALAASVIGFENVSVYDGSWTEYGTLN